MTGRQITCSDRALEAWPYSSSSALARRRQKGLVGISESDYDKGLCIPSRESQACSAQGWESTRT